MAKKSIRVYSADASGSLGFKNIAKLEHVDTLNADDIILVVDKNGDGDVHNVEIRELAAFFSEVNTNMQWYLPKVNGSVVSFEWSELTSEDPAPIDILDMIPLASESTIGLMNASDYAKLKKITPYEPDGKTIVADSDGILSVVAGTPIRKKLLIPASGWDTDTKTQKVSVAVNTENRNVIDVPPEYVRTFSNYQILAISEEETGITFQCSTIPTIDVTCYLTSMGVIDNAD